MNSSSAAHDQHQKDFLNAFFQSETGGELDQRGREPDMFNNGNLSLPPMMNLSQQTFSNPQASMDVLENLMAMQDRVGQAAASQVGQPTTPQILLEQQMRLNQLQQLQQLQNQIFQQQIELLSSNSSFAASPPVMDRSRDQQHFGLPTPASSTELHAQNTSDFVSPMLLQNRNSGMQSLPPQSQQQFLPHPMIPSAPHSAPANIAFGTYPMQTDLDFSEISPLTSPWLGAAYGPSGPQPSTSTTVHNTQQALTSSSNKKRRAASPGSDEQSTLTAAGRPARKRQPSVNRLTPAVPPIQAKKANMRGSKSANSTPLFPPISSGNRMSPAHRTPATTNDIPGDTPSPVDLAMPPPAPPAGSSVVMNSNSSSIQFVQGPSSSSSGHNTPNSHAATPEQLMPVTPASIMNLGRLGTNSSLAPPAANNQEKNMRTRSSRARSSTLTSTSSTVLKPILPGNATPTSTSPTTASQPPILQVRKTSHKAAEQKRRDSLKKSYDDLRVLLPPIPLPSDEGYPDEPPLPGAMPPRGPPKGNADGPNRSVSKLQLLRCGNEFIRVLKARVERRDDEIEILRREVARLRLVAGDAGQPEDGVEEIDLEKDLDAVEMIGGGIFGRSQMGRIMEGEEGDEDGAD
ncbi:unnamed protein product [Somion occarium]|uniref:BHLH domain-containing protein n=1 Tax=Somion occarium TaxID=3059160 RepID=A0ABP1CX27_9APHY